MLQYTSFIAAGASNPKLNPRDGDLYTKHEDKISEMLMEWDYCIVFHDNKRLTNFNRLKERKWKGWDFMKSVECDQFWVFYLGNQYPWYLNSFWLHLLYSAWSCDSAALVYLPLIVYSHNDMLCMHVEPSEIAEDIQKEIYIVVFVIKKNASNLN